ncbi:MAG TPA: hypothetical protein VHM20_07580, partial [Gammaproteobacteria bacterium]|nr:hypothetical protein [Gammaproteobacteria bacterium]
MPNTIGQEIIRHPMQELGFGKFNGLCKGFTDAFIEDILQLKLNFSETIQSIQDMPDLIEKLRTFITKNEMLISFPEEKKKDFSDEDLVYKNIIKLFKIIKVYQNDLHIPFEVTEKKLNKNSENLKKVYTDEVIYTVKEWCFYLSELRDILQKEEQATLAISISLKWNFYDPVLRELIDHNVGLYYDRDNDKWWLADINFLPTPQPMLCSNLDKTTSHLLPIENNELKTIPLKIIKNGALPLLLKSLYFKDNDYIPANIRIFTQEKNPRLEQIKLKFSEF